MGRKLSMITFSLVSQLIKVLGCIGLRLLYVLNFIFHSDNIRSLNQQADFYLSLEKLSLAYVISNKLFQKFLRSNSFRISLCV